ncbi:response regulator transcription factor [Alteromonas sp. NFXS44]|uniref:response regulator transcription factor n=1 Tax=Alteromonas sp. NFXS44 TaxID=2818435 RepID=UPI002EA70ADD|nr:response regulator transcription factor [Pseudomonadota bacterium]
MSILLIEDDKGLAELLTEFLGMSGYDVTHCADGESGLAEALARSDIELVLLDVMLPGLNGLDVLKAIRQKSELPVLMLTARGDDLDKVLGLELGADDYLAKPFNDRELLARIRAIIRRTGDKAATDEPASLSKKSVIPIGDISIDVQKMVVTCQSQVLDLTGSEYALLKHLCLQPGELITKEELSEACLGRRLQAFDRSIDTHISNLRKKLTAANSQVDIKSQRGRGYGIFA